MCAIPQLVSAPFNPIPIAEHFRRSHPQCELMSNLTRFVLELTYTRNTYLANPRETRSAVLHSS